MTATDLKQWVIDWKMSFDLQKCEFLIGQSTSNKRKPIM